MYQLVNEQYVMGIKWKYSNRIDKK